MTSANCWISEQFDDLDHFLNLSFLFSPVNLPRFTSKMTSPRRRRRRHRRRPRQESVQRKQSPCRAIQGETPTANVADGAVQRFPFSLTVAVATRATEGRRGAGPLRRPPSRVKCREEVLLLSQISFSVLCKWLRRYWEVFMEVRSYKGWSRWTQSAHVYITKM